MRAVPTHLDNAIDREMIFSHTKSSIGLGLYAYPMTEKCMITSDLSIC